MVKPNPFDVLGKAGSLYQSNIGPCMAVGCIYFVIQMVLAIPSYAIEGAYTDVLEMGWEANPEKAIMLLVFTFFLAFAQIAVQSIMGLGLGGFALRIVDSGSAEVGDLVPDIELLPGGFIAGFVASLLVSAGIMLCCIGVVPAFASTLFWPFFLLDRRGGGGAAIQDGIQTVYENPMPNLLFGTALMFLWFVNAVLCCYFPSLFIVPFFYLACALAYRQIHAAPESLSES